MSPLPSSGTIIVTKVDENDDYVEEVLDASDIPINTSGSQYTKAGIIGNYIQDAFDSIPTSINNRNRDNYILVKELEDFPSPVSGVISLSGGVTYDLNGLIYLDINRIELGNSTILLGNCKSSDGLVYSGTESMITANNKSFAIKWINLDSPVSGSQVFDIQNGSSNQILIDNVNFGTYEGCNSLGTISGGLSLRYLDNQFLTNSKNGITIDKTNLIFIKDNDFISNTSGTTFITITSGTEDIYNSLIIEGNKFALQENQTALSIPNITVSGGCLISNNIFSPRADDLTGNPLELTDFISDNIFFEVIGNYRLKNSRYSGFLSFFENTTQTIISSTTSYYKAAGLNYETVLHRLSTDNVDNRLKYLGLCNRIFDISCVGSVSSTGPNDTLRVLVYHFDVSLTQENKVSEIEIRTITANEPVNFALNGIVEMDTNDYLEVHVRNTTSNNKNVVLEFLEFKVTGK